MALDAPIATAARGFLPITWDALLTDTERYGDGMLQDQVDFVKERLFGEVIADGDEFDYTLRVIRFAGMMVAYNLIIPGIDYWMNSTLTETVMDSREIATWANRAEELRKLGETLGLRIKQEEGEILGVLGTPRVSKVSVPLLSSMNDDRLTPDPQLFPLPYKLPQT